MLVGSIACSVGSSTLLCLLRLKLACLQLTTNLIKKAEQGVNGLIAKLGAPAVLSQHSPHASVQQLLHATRSLGELNAGSALGSFDVSFQCCLNAGHWPSFLLFCFVNMSLHFSLSCKPACKSIIFALLFVYTTSLCTHKDTLQCRLHFAGAIPNIVTSLAL